MAIMLLVAFALVALFLLRDALKARERKGKIIPGPVGIPVAGYAFWTSLETLNIEMSKQADKYGDITSITIFGTRLIFLNSEAMIRRAFTGSGKQFLNDRPTMFVQGHFYPDGSIGLNNRGHMHNALRKAFTKGFHVYGDGIEAFETTVKSEIVHLLEHIEEFQGKDFEVTEVIRKSVISLMSVFRTVKLSDQDAWMCRLIWNYTVRIYMFECPDYITTLVVGSNVSIAIALNAFGIGVDYKRNPLNAFVILSGRGLKEEDPLLTAIWDYVQAVNAIGSPTCDAVMTMFPFVRHLPGFYKNIYEQLTNCRDKVLNEFFHRVVKREKSTTRQGLVEHLLAEQKHEVEGMDAVLTDSRIIGVIHDVLLAGIVTTFTSLCSTILCLMHHPEICRRMQAEILQVVGKDRLPRLADKERCPLTEAVFLEVQRFVTIVPLGGPHFCREHTSLEGYDIPANSIVFANLWHVHHRHEVWGDPWAFRPDRFLDDNGQLLPRSHSVRENLLPFGVGRRQCAGEVLARSRIFLYVTSLLQRWTFIPSDDNSESCDPRSDQFNAATLIMTPKPFYCRVIDYKC